MKNLNKYILSLALIASVSTFAQEAAEGEPTTIQGLLQLVEQGRTTEQSVNAKREAEFLADKNKQAAKLAAEKRELARQERIADQLEAEYKKNDAILVVKEAAYKKELGSLVELFGHLQSSAGEASALFADSLTSAQYGRERESFLNELSSKMSSATVESLRVFGMNFKERWLQGLKLFLSMQMLLILMVNQRIAWLLEWDSIMLSVMANI